MRQIMNDVSVFLASEPPRDKCDPMKHTSFLCGSPFLPFIQHGLNKETSAETLQQMSLNQVKINTRVGCKERRRIARAL